MEDDTSSPFLHDFSILYLHLPEGGMGMLKKQLSLLVVLAIAATLISVTSVDAA
jgi:hypothetical protein